NPLSGILMVIFLLGVSLINWVVPVNHSKPIEVTPKVEEHPNSIHWLQSIGQLTRINVWLGSIFLLTIAFLLLGGSPLSSPPLPLYDSITWFRFGAALFSASLLNSFIFVQNQLGDLDTDRLHPQKSQLPIASGHLSRRSGFILAIVFLIFAIGLSLFVSLAFFAVLIAIVLLGFLYSGPPLRLKAKPIVDLAMIGLAFGTMAVIAAWVILATLPELPVLLLIGSGLYYAGTHSVHTASDYGADNQAGLQTTAVFLGRQHTMRLGLLLVAMGLASLYIVAGYYTHLFWYGILKFKSIFLFTFCGLPLFAVLGTYRKSDKTTTGSNTNIDQLRQQGRNAAYCLFLIILIYCLLYVYLFYPTYYS
ncbi:MAG: UbiA prenyltransferase family protein, partial [Promethearchaeota archaeon]